MKLSLIRPQFGIWYTIVDLDTDITYAKFIEYNDAQKYLMGKEREINAFMMYETMNSENDYIFENKSDLSDLDE